MAAACLGLRVFLGFNALLGLRRSKPAKNDKRNFGPEAWDVPPITVLNRDCSTPYILIPIKDCSYKAEHPNPKP